MDTLAFLGCANFGLGETPDAAGWGATKHSKLHAIVLKFSRTRKRYERQGVLVEKAALDHAETECLGDADARARIRERSAVRRQELDAEYVRAFTDRIKELYPGCPIKEANSIAEHACPKAPGRVGRSAAAKRFEPKTIELAVRAHSPRAHELRRPARSRP